MFTEVGSNIFHTKETESKGLGKTSPSPVDLFVSFKARWVGEIKSFKSFSLL